MQPEEIRRSPLLPSSWELPDAIIRRVGDTVGRQRAMIAEGHLLLLLHAVPGPDVADRHGALFWRAPSGEWRASVGRGAGHTALLAHIKSYDDAVDALEKRTESADSADDWFDIIKAAVPLHRSARNMLATLQSAREALPDARQLIIARDLAIDVERGAELVHEEAEHGLRFAQAHQAEAQAQAAEQMARAGHRLNMLAALFLPLTAVGGLFGMNLPFGFEAEPWMFYAALAASVVFGLLFSRQLSGARR
ncbi:MAG: CorA family divalent cation transporter [bacterium]